MEQALSNEISELIGIIEEEEEIDLFDPVDSMETEQLMQQLLDELEGEELDGISEISDFIGKKFKKTTPKKAAKGKIGKSAAAYL